ncbi:MAG: endolytic transglycosylase MltG, partial [Xanthomonadales bacterium]|nr:endolytic transglycosylase MltG [Xanthomonadales bacterium]
AQLAALLDSNDILEHRFDLSDAAQRAEALSKLDIDHPEGWFLPETYQFTRGDSDLDILTRSHRAMRAELEQAWASRVEDLPLNSPYELLILASIVEKETALDSERGQIAGVFVRRLKKGMKLQTDPTVIYGLGASFDGDIRKRDLQADTPYNTYTRHGLPPTPISMPGRASLQAAAQPADGETLFFVADGNGGHTFSVTLEEHQAAVNRLLGKE